MPPFTYDPYRNPYAGTIADMLARRGEIAARSAENIGGINARATEQRGAAWAGAAQNIGQIAAGIPLQMQQQRQQALVNRERAARTAATEQGTQFDADAKAASEQAQRRVGELIKQYRTEDGGADWPKIAEMTAEFAPDVAEQFLKLDKETKAERDATGKRLEAFKAGQALTSARIAAQSTDFDNFIARVDMFVADGKMDEGNRNAVLKRAMAAGEDGWPAFQQEIIKGSPEFEDEQLKKKGEEADIAYKEAQTKALGVPKPPTVGSLEDFLLRMYGPSPTGKQITAGKAIYESAGRAPEGGVTPNAALESTLKLRDRFVRETQAAQAVKTQYNLMKASLEAVKKGALAAGSQGVLVTFQKILDPTSVVRESEYARSSAGLSMLNRIEGQWQTIQKGGAGVPVEELEKFVTLSEQFVRNQARAAQVTKDQIDGIAREFGLKPGNITSELGLPAEGGEEWVRDPKTGELVKQGSQ